MLINIIYFIIFILLCLGFCCLCWVEAIFDRFNNNDDYDYYYLQK